MTYDLYYNIAANEYSYSKANYFDFVKEFSSIEERDRYIEKKVIDSIVWVVFYNTAAGKGFIERHGYGSGNFRGSMHGYYRNIGEYETESAALEALKRILEG